MNKLVAIFIVLLAILSGCSNAGTNPAAQVSSNEQETTAENLHAHEHGSTTDTTHAQEHGSTEFPLEEQSKYTLTGSVDDAYELLLETNLQFSKENYNKSHQEGEGHVHLYVNDRLIGPLQEKGPHPVSGYLTDGENTIKLALASNNHLESKYKIRYTITVTYRSPADDTAE